MTKNLKSKCCGAKVSIGGIGDFRDRDQVPTHYYVCNKCDKPCDVGAEEKPESWEEDLIKLYAKDKTYITLDMKTGEYSLTSNFKSFIRSLLKSEIKRAFEAVRGDIDKKIDEIDEGKISGSDAFLSGKIDSYYEIRKQLTEEQKRREKIYLDGL